MSIKPLRQQLSGKEYVQSGEGETFGVSSPKSPGEHMARRHAAGSSYRGLAQDFGSSKSTTHRKANAFRNGFNKLGSAQ